MTNKHTHTNYPWPWFLDEVEDITNREGRFNGPIYRLNDLNVVIFLYQVFSFFHYNHYHSFQSHCASFFDEGHRISNIVLQIINQSKSTLWWWIAPPCHVSSSQPLVRKPRTSRPSGGPVASAPELFDSSFGSGIFIPRNKTCPNVSCAVLSSLLFLVHMKILFFI